MAILYFSIKTQRKHLIENCKFAIGETGLYRLLRNIGDVEERLSIDLFLCRAKAYRNL
jgi:hypothetical protein